MGGAFLSLLRSGVIGLMVCRVNVRQYSQDFERLKKTFWPRVKRSAGCWVWQGSTKPTGYGVITLGGRRTRKTSINAHRVAWILTHGDPGAKDVLHRCDVRGCVRPDHLFLGTHAENMDDCTRKNRWPRRDLRKVAEIRRLRSSGVSRVEIAARHGLALRTVGYYLNDWRQS